MKNILRKRNSGTPARLTRGLSQKTLDIPDNSPSPKSPTRTFLLETPVQFTTVRGKDFLFITYKLKDIGFREFQRTIKNY